MIHIRSESLRHPNVTSKKSMLSWKDSGSGPLEDVFPFPDSCWKPGGIAEIHPVSRTSTVCVRAPKNNVDAAQLKIYLIIQTQYPRSDLGTETRPLNFSNAIATSATATVCSRMYFYPYKPREERGKCVVS